MGNNSLFFIPNICKLSVSFPRPGTFLILGGCSPDILTLYNISDIPTTNNVLRCVIPVVLGQKYKNAVCIYLYIHRVMNTTTLQLVAIYNII